MWCVLAGCLECGGDLSGVLRHGTLSTPSDFTADICYNALALEGDVLREISQSYNNSCGAGDRAQQLRVWAVPSENPSPQDPPVPQTVTTSTEIQCLQHPQAPELTYTDIHIFLSLFKHLHEPIFERRRSSASTRSSSEKERGRKRELRSEKRALGL